MSPNPAQPSKTAQIPAPLLACPRADFSAADRSLALSPAVYRVRPSCDTPVSLTGRGGIRVRRRSPRQHPLPAGETGRFVGLTFHAPAVGCPGGDDRGRG